MFLLRILNQSCILITHLCTILYFSQSIAIMIRNDTRHPLVPDEEHSHLVLPDWPAPNPQ